MSVAIKQGISSEDRSRLIEDLLKEGLTPGDARQSIIEFEDFIFNPDVHEITRLGDKTWHAFILRTRDYTRFCKKNFGKYIHHFRREDGCTGGPCAECTDVGGE